MKIFFYFVFITITFSYCGKPCIESRGIEGAGLTITFFNNANNEYFYPENTNLSPYKIDSLRVKDSQGHLLTTPYHVNSDPVNPLKGFMYPLFTQFLFLKMIRLLLTANKQSISTLNITITLSTL